MIIERLILFGAKAVCTVECIEWGKLVVFFAINKRHLVVILCTDRFNDCISFYRARWATVPCCGVWCGQWFWSCLAGRLDWSVRYFTVCSARAPRVATAVLSLSICWTVASSSLWLVHRIWWRGSRCVKHVGCINPKFLTLLILWRFSYNDVPEILHAFCTIDVFIKGNVLRVTFKRFFFWGCNSQCIYI